MKAAVVHESFVVALDHDESCCLMNGSTIGDRINPIVPDAKVIVRPMQDLDPTYEPVEEPFTDEYNERLRTVQSVVHILGDQDIIIYVPPEVPRITLISAETIARDAVMALASDDPEGLRNTLPDNGITIRFDNGIGDREFWNLIHPEE